jgi:nucleotide-binding universal stress UspA family protein
MFRTVLVHVNNMETSEARTRFAIAVARQYDASLIGVTAGLPQVPIEIYTAGAGVAGISPEYSDFSRKQLEAEFGKTQRAFSAATESSGLEGSWRAYLEIPAVAVAAAAGAADILVVGPGDRSSLGDAGSAAAGDIILRVGRPVLVAPEGMTSLNARNVLVAWKDTSQAQRAIADALPFMKRAESVVVATIDEGQTRSSGLADAVAFLVRHGIAAKGETIEAKGEPVHQQLLDMAGKRQTDLIVSGAYGRSRLREWVFGGVTRGLLMQSRLPCLFSH